VDRNEALLALIADLYAQVAALKAETAALRRHLADHPANRESTARD
jgi:cell division protein FtsB